MPHVPHPSEPELGLFYVGISPRDAASRATVRSRVIGQHLGGNIGSSTFRYVLSALLRDTLSLRPLKRGTKLALEPADSDRLWQWQRHHLRLTWCSYARPWEIESDVISVMHPPLNSAGNATHPFFPYVRRARAALREAADRVHEVPDAADGRHGR